MTNVIGLKGTAEERLLSWNTMLFLRKLLSWKENPATETEKDWYDQEFAKYLKAANDNDPKVEKVA